MRNGPVQVYLCSLSSLQLGGSQPAVFQMTTQYPTAISYTDTVKQNTVLMPLSAAENIWGKCEVLVHFYYFFKTVQAS